jgi:phosphatidylglycerol:prolipoprotein diacylglycerol transferase
MYPTLLSFGIFRFHSYTVMMSLGFLLAAILAVRENYKLERPYPVTTMCGLWAFIFALVGSRAWHIVQYTEWTWMDLLLSVRFWEGPGLVFYGGLAGGVLGAAIYLKWVRVPFLPMGDIAMPFIPLGHAVARLGCFLNGCCWGRTTTMPWGVSYPKRDIGAYAQQLEAGLITPSAPCSLPCHPSQVYESIGLVFLFFIMRYAYKRGWHQGRPGAVLFLYPMLYGVLRFFIETFRADNAHTVLQRFTVSQMVAVGFVLVSLTGWSVLKLTVWKAESAPTTSNEPEEVPVDTPEE